MHYRDAINIEDLRGIARRRLPRFVFSYVDSGAEDELTLTALHPDKRVEDAQANTGWDLKIASKLRTTAPPTAHELQLLRDELDPDGIYLKGGV